MEAARRIYWGYALFVLLCVGVGVAAEAYWLAGVPVFAAVVYQAFTNFRPLFWLMIVMIPLGTELFLPGGIGTDVPTEPLAIGLTGVLLLHALNWWPTYKQSWFLHPVALLIYAHVGWVWFTSLASELPIISLKFSLAKGWYVGAFFLVPLLIIRSPDRVRTFAHCLVWPLVFVAAQTLVRHAAYGFSFSDQFRTMSPFMRNHISYAGCLAAAAPWLVYLAYGSWARSQVRGVGISLSKRAAWIGLGLFWVVAIYFSYTRAAMVSLVLIGMTYYALRWRLLRAGLILGLVLGLGVTTYLVQDNRFLDYAPNYDTTISHENFDNLLSATYKLEDVSTMERFYRWVAGGNMVPAHPWIGWGPGTFVERYKGYTVNNFETYVSDNPERSGIHNYFLMTLVEQGFIGLLVVLTLMIGILWYGQGAYHRQEDRQARSAIAAALCSIVVVSAFSIINDVLETDKMGSLYFLAAAILIAMDRYQRPVVSGAGE